MAKVHLHSNVVGRDKAQRDTFKPTGSLAPDIQPLRSDGTLIRCHSRLLVLAVVACQLLILGNLCRRRKNCRQPPSGQQLSISEFAAIAENSTHGRETNPRTIPSASASTLCPLHQPSETPPPPPSRRTNSFFFFSFADSFIHLVPHTAPLVHDRPRIDRSIVFLVPLQGRKKKFIDKKESSTFHVVHRSQQDKAKEGEGDASEFVLIPSGVSERGLRVFCWRPWSLAGPNQPAGMTRARPTVEPSYTPRAYGCGCM